MSEPTSVSRGSLITQAEMKRTERELHAAAVRWADAAAEYGRMRHDLLGEYLHARRAHNAAVTAHQESMRWRRALDRLAS